ncbi:hypothetical protein NL676_014819 [Syzygium grande]|nr:hypothetical protein NL676_014819 [Syzygium grande]
MAIASSPCKVYIRTTSLPPIYTPTGRSKSSQPPRPTTAVPFSIYTAKLLVYVLSTGALPFVLSRSPSCNRSRLLPLNGLSLSLVHRWRKVILETASVVAPDPTTERLRDARLRFPSDSSKGRVLCLKGRNVHDGSRNYYALAWPDALPRDTTFVSGLTFVSYNHYDYGNIWHGLSTVFPFVAWHQEQGCRHLPKRWVQYHWGELRPGMAPWPSKLMEATFGKPPSVEIFDKIEEDSPVCFEEAVMMRHSEGGMSMERMIEAYELLRCSVRRYCSLSSEDDGDGNKGNTVRLTLLMRRGARSFRNESAVAGIFQRECDKVEGCRLTMARSDDLSFCDQVGA